MKSKDITLGSRIKAVMTKYNITQKELAAKLHISPVSINATIHNPNIKVGTLERFAEVIGCEVVEFFTITLPEKQPKEPAENPFSMRSPKNPYRVRIIYDKALKGLGSVDSFTTTSADAAERIAEGNVQRNKMGATITIMHNVAGYPNFDWQLVETYHLDKSGKRTD